MDIFDTLDMDSALEELTTIDEANKVFNTDNVSSAADYALHRSYFMTFDDRTKKQVHFFPSFIGAAEDFFRKECSAGRPEAVNRWKMLAGSLVFKNNDWYKKHKEKEVCVWSYWHGGEMASRMTLMIINPAIASVLFPYDYRDKGEDHKVDNRSSMRKMKLMNVLHKIDAILTS